MNKKIMMIEILLLMMALILSGCLESTIYRRQSVQNLQLSSDGKKLLTSSVTTQFASPYASDKYENYIEYIFWDVYNGTILRSEQSNHIQDIYLSPSGSYYINDTDKTIMSPFTGRIVSYIGKYQDWAENNDFFITSENNQIYLWNANNFTIKRTITMNQSIWKVSISPTSTKIVAFYNTPTYILLSIIDISQDNTVYLWNKTIESQTSFSWSNDGKKIQIISGQSTENYSIERCNLTIWNATNGEILKYLLFEYKLDKWAYNQIIFTSYGKYVIDDNENKELRIYNFSGLERTINYTYQRIKGFAWSQDAMTLAFGTTDGDIEIRNASTGDLIITLETPLYKYVQPFVLHPFYSLFIIPITIFIAVFVIAVVILLLNKRKNNKKR